jgi:hypothetical protein
VGGTLIDEITYSSVSVGASAQRHPTGSNFCVSTTSYGDGDLGKPGAGNIACP